VLGEVLDNDEQNLTRSCAVRVINERDSGGVERQKRSLAGGGLGHESEAGRKRREGERRRQGMDSS
jgi:hypothetical protein